MNYTEQCKICDGWLDSPRSDLRCDCRTLNQRIVELERELRSLREQTPDALRRALAELSMREAEYRRCHDVHGDGSHEAGYAWDQMRRAGDKARRALQEQPESDV